MGFVRGGPGSPGQLQRETLRVLGLRASTAPEPVPRPSTGRSAVSAEPTETSETPSKDFRFADRLAATGTPGRPGLSRVGTSVGRVGRRPRNRPALGR
jgi:hypothetical protein